MNQKERMLSGLPYKAWLDGLSQERLACQEKLGRFNALPPQAREEAAALLKELFGKTRESVHVVPPLYCDYGTNIQVGENFFANYHFTVLDCAPVTIGDNVWIGGNVVICPGVTIGDCAVIGAGSVVTRDVPPWTVAAGNPCRVLRQITEADRDFYYKDRKFDVDDYR